MAAAGRSLRRRFGFREKPREATMVKAIVSQISSSVLRSALPAENVSKAYDEVQRGLEPLLSPFL
ncbi:hypothetical protein YC2023_104842 [Brassica napus]